MAYGGVARERAFGLYLQGFNPEQIAEMLRESYPKISANTIRTWAENGDWAHNRSTVETIVKRRIEEHTASQRERQLSRCETLTGEIYTKLTSKSAPEAKSFEGMAYAMIALSKFANQLDDENQDRFSPIAAAELMLGTLNEIPEVRKVIEAHWPRIRQALSAKLSSVTRTKEIQATGEPEGAHL